MLHGRSNQGAPAAQPEETDTQAPVELGLEDLDAVAGGFGMLQPSIPRSSTGVGLPATEAATCISRLG